MNFSHKLYAFLVFLDLIGFIESRKYTDKTDFRKRVKCNSAAKLFEGVTCVQEEPLGKGSKSLAFNVMYQNKSVVLLLQDKNATETMKILNKIGDHPYIIKIHEAKILKKWSLLLMEFGTYGNLHNFRRDFFDLIKNSTFAMELFYKIVDGVEHMNLKGIVHSDLKHGNIVIDKDFNPKIIDFELSSKKNWFYHWKGTNSYMAPEVIASYITKNDLRYTQKIDVYSLGVILYRLLYSGYPFTGENREAVYEVIMQHVYNIGQGLPIRIAKILEKCLKLYRTKRGNLKTIKTEISDYLKDENPVKLWRDEIFSNVSDHIYIEEIKTLVTRPDIIVPIGIAALGWGLGSRFIGSSSFF